MSSVITKILCSFIDSYRVEMSNIVRGSHQDNMSVPFIPLTPHIYIVKMGFTGVYIIFLFLLLNIDCGFSLEPPQNMK